MKHYKNANNELFGFEDGATLPAGLTEITMEEVAQINEDKITPAQRVEMAKSLALTEFNETITMLTGNTPKVESDSWPKQEIEARDLTKQTLLIDQLIIDRGLGETREQLATKIIANADAYAPLYAKALGVYQAKIKALV